MLKHSLVALAAMGAGLIGFSGAEASAFPVQKPAIQTDSTSSLLVDVKQRKGKNRKNWTHYSRSHHGERCRSRRGNCRHYHRGYYYANPWWLLPMVGAGITLNQRNYGGYGSSHVEWCLNRYRSYNVRNNTWVSYSGEVRQCASPYRR